MTVHGLCIAISQRPAVLPAADPIMQGVFYPFPLFVCDYLP